MMVVRFQSKDWWFCLGISNKHTGDISKKKFHLQAQTGFPSWQLTRKITNPATPWQWETHSILRNLYPRVLTSSYNRIPIWHLLNLSRSVTSLSIADTRDFWWRLGPHGADVFVFVEGLMLFVFFVRKRRDRTSFLQGLLLFKTWSCSWYILHIFIEQRKPPPTHE